MKLSGLKTLFLVKHRYIIGYCLLGVVFAGLLFFLPLFSIGGVSEDEMLSSVSSNALSFNSFAVGDVADLVYRVLQKLSIVVFGLSIYAIKLPSILLGIASGVFLILILNRWYKSNIALIATAATVLSSIFLFLACSGTPVIMYIFWLTLMLWMTAKLLDLRAPNSWLVFAFVATVALAAYTPHIIYISVLLLLAGLFQPHLRFSLKTLGRAQYIIAISLFVVIVAPLIVGFFANPELLQTMFGIVAGTDFVTNITYAYVPFFSFAASFESIYLSPLFGLATIVLAIIGAVASGRHMYAARNLGLTMLIIFSIVGSGLNPNLAVVIFIPIAMLVAGGIEYIFSRWYALFPLNPYARVFCWIPIAALVAIIVVSNIGHFFYGYRYTPMVATEFNDDVSLVRTNVKSGTVLLVPPDGAKFDFYKMLEQDMSITVATEVSDRATSVATLGRWNGEIKLPLTRVITSAKSQDSDRIYIYNQLNTEE